MYNYSIKMQVFVFCVYVALSRSVIANEASVDKGSYVRELTDTPTTDVNGKVVFKDLETIYVQDQEYPSQYVNVSKVDICGNVNRLSSSDHNVAFYISGNGGVSCLNDCDGSNNCIARCMRRTSNGIKFYTEAATLNLASSQGEVDLDIAIEEIPTEVNANKTRRRRGVGSPTGGDHMIKILYALDKGCMDVFVMISEDNSTQNARMEAELFVMLQTCEVALHFASLEKHNAALQFDGAEYQVKLTTALSGIVFPDETSSGTGFKNTYWSEKNRDGDLLISERYEHYYSQNFIAQRGVTTDFAKYLDDKLPRPNNFDLAIALTGYDLTQKVHCSQGNDKWIDRSDQDLGASVYSNSTCRIWNIRDVSSGVVEIYSLGLSRIISQGIAIMLGAQQDCLAPTNTSPYNFVHNSETTEFETFSSCSAQQIANYISRIPADKRLPGCLSMLGSSEINFLAEFCNGTSRTAYTLDAQCAQMYPTSPQACVEDDYVRFDDCLNKVNRFMVKCSDTDICDTAEEGDELRKVIDGTKCRNEDGTKGNKICYMGCCVDSTKLCPV